MKSYPLRHGVSFHPLISSVRQNVSMNLWLRYTNQLLAHANNTVNGHNVFVCTLLHRKLYNAADI